MLKHRLSKFGNATLQAFAVLLVGSMLFSCQDMLDDYPYDDGGDPSWLGSSVYEFLRSNESGHTYNYYADIVDDLDEAETFKHTGSKTVFVADDDAFERFFANNHWGVTCYEDLTYAQKKILLKASMLDDAMLLDMLSASSANEKDEGTCMRRVTSLSAVDSIPVVTAAETPAYNKYWDALRGKERDEKMLLAMDNTKPTIVYFLPDFLRNSGISEEDMSFFFRKNGEQVKTYKKGEAYIFDKKIMRSDIPTDGFSDDTMTITCKNGYLYRLDDVLVPPSNMAAELRRRDDTQLMSHLIERYSIPVFNAELTREYNSVTGKPDSVFVWSYYTKDPGVGGGIGFNDPILKDGQRPSTSTDLLPFNPGWNQYAPSFMHADMGVILAPNDAAMYHYFTEGPGMLILSKFNASDEEGYVQVEDVESLKLALNRIPDNIVSSLLSILMRKSFVTTVPSRFDNITDDSNDEISGVKEAVTECVFANNGVIYILNEVFGPYEYNAVSAPTSIFSNLIIIRHVIKELGYNSFLLAKKAEYTLFMPDNSSWVYYDPVSIIRNEVDTDKKPTAYQLFYDANHPKKKGSEILYAKMYEFDPVTYEVNTDEDKVQYTDLSTTTKENENLITIGDKGKNFGGVNLKGFKGFMYNRMSDLIDYLIVVDSINENSTKKYYRAKNGGALKVDLTDPQNIIFQGGEQVENGHRVAHSIVFEQANGTSYTTVPYEERDNSHLYSGFPSPSTKSLYKQITSQVVASDENSNIQYNEDAPFYEFLKLTDPSVSGIIFDSLLVKVFPDAALTRVISDTLKNYSVFYSTKTNNVRDGRLVNTVPFFNGYNYTVYIPQNSAIQEIVNEGLPTWDDVWACATGEGIYAAEGKAPAKAASAMRLLREFIRYHFHDNSLFVDNVTSSKKYSTQSFAGGSSLMRVDVQQQPGSIVIKDDCGGYANVITDGEENKTWNVLCRDIEIENKNWTIVTSSFSVAHLIDNTLKTSYLYGYDGRFKRFAINGELVDAMDVTGNTGDGLCEVNGKNCYLVARVDDSHGYLMIPRNGAFNKLTREDYKYDNDGDGVGDGELICIDKEGFRVIREVKTDSKTKKEVVTYKYYLDEDENKLKYANNGTVIERVSTKAPETEDNNTEVVE